MLVVILRKAVLKDKLRSRQPRIAHLGSGIGGTERFSSDLTQFRLRVAHPVHDSHCEVRVHKIMHCCAGEVAEWLKAAVC